MVIKSKKKFIISSEKTPRKRDLVVKTYSFYCGKTNRTQRNCKLLEPPSTQERNHFYLKSTTCWTISDCVTNQKTILNIKIKVQHYKLVVYQTVSSLNWEERFLWRIQMQRLCRPTIPF